MIDHEPDLLALLSVLSDAADREVLEALSGTGLRRGHGYVVQRLLAGPATPTEMAGDLGVTQQAVSKVVRELAALGHVEAVEDAGDRRRRPVALTRSGRSAVRRARRVRAGLEERVRAAIGDAELVRTRATLLAALDALGLAESVVARTTRPPTGELAD